MPARKSKPFVARKTRMRAAAPTQKIGNALLMSYATSVEYRREIFKLVWAELMPPVQKVGDSVFIGDRISLLSMLGLNDLRKRAFSLASSFVTKVNRRSERSTWSELEALGKELTVSSPLVTTTLSEQIEINVGLITDLTDEFRQKLVTLYTDKTIDQSEIYPTLRRELGNRAALIAEDQNAKIFTTLNTERMLGSGLKTFYWDHSSAGKYPRKCHQLRDGHEFLLTLDPSRLYWPDGSPADADFGGKKGDAGLPGYAIRCRCRMRPVVSLDD
jgi:hypothetical protein